MADTPPSEAAVFPRPGSSCVEPAAADGDKLFVEAEPQQSWGVSEGLLLRPDTDRMGAFAGGLTRMNRVFGSLWCTWTYCRNHTLLSQTEADVWWWPHQSRGCRFGVSLARCRGCSCTSGASHWHLHSGWGRRHMTNLHIKKHLEEAGWGPVGICLERVSLHWCVLEKGRGSGFFIVFNQLVSATGQITAQTV